MEMVGRAYNPSLYRFGFNGKEDDNEVKGIGTQIDYGMRIYDPRLCKFLSIDPLTAKYAYLTPYQFGSNRPIDGIDLDGLEYVGYVTLEETTHPKPMTARDKKILNGVVLIGGGALLIAGTWGAASPWVAAGFLTTGTYSVVAGGTKLGLDATGNEKAADAIPSSYTGATLGKTVDAVRGGKDRIAEKSFDLVETAATFPYELNAEKIFDQGIGLYEGYEGYNELKDQIYANPANAPADIKTIPNGNLTSAGSGKNVVTTQTNSSSNSSARNQPSSNNAPKTNQSSSNNNASPKQQTSSNATTSKPAVKSQGTSNSSSSGGGGHGLNFPTKSY